MKSPVRIAAWSLVAVAAASAALSQSPRFGEETNVVAVEIPVQVLVDGEPVKGLTKENFEVSEGRKSRPIVGFDVVDLAVAQTDHGRPAAVSTEIPAAGRRYFLLLFDLSNSDPAAMTRARGAARDLVIKNLHPSDLVGVANWSYSQGPKLILGFTSDRRQIEAAVENLGVVELRNRAPDPLGLQLAALERNNPAPSGGAGGQGIGAAEKDQMFLDNLRDFAATERASARQVKGDEVKAFTQGFGSMAQLMSTLVGRKYVVLLSQGFDSSLLVGSTDPSVEAAASAAVESGETWNVNSEERFGNTQLTNQLEQMLITFRRADCAIQAVDIGGMAAGGDATGFARPSGRDTMLTMAKDTGGQFYDNFNDLGQAMNKMLEATSVTYVLTIQPDDLKWDGKFHDLKVKLRNGPSGAKVVARPGYFAPKPFDQRGGAEQKMETAQLLLSGEPGGALDAAVTAPVFRGEGRQMHVPVVLEVPGSALLGAKTGAGIPLAVYAYAFDPAGAIVDFVAQGLQLDAAQVGPRLQGATLRFVGDLRLPPGSYALRTLVRIGDKGDYWLEHSAIEVPAFGPGELVAVSPVIPTPMTQGLVVRSAASAEKTKGLPFPFAAGQEFFLPDPMAAIGRGKSGRMVLNVYGLAAGAAQVSGELIGVDGKTVADASVAAGARTASDQPGLERFDLTVSPGSAAAGTYTLRVTVAQGDRKSVSYASLRVAS